MGHSTGKCPNHFPWIVLVAAVKAFCSSITGTLATHAVLTGVGVGDDKASATAATITWLLKGTNITNLIYPNITVTSY